MVQHVAGGRRAAAGGRHACVRASLSLLFSPHSLYISHTQNRYPTLRGDDPVAPDLRVLSHPPTPLPNTPTRALPVPHRPQACLAGWLAGRGGRIFDFFLFFQNGLKRAPRALGGPGGPWGPYFPLFLPYFRPFSGPLGGPWGGPGGPLFALKGCCAVGKHLRCNLHWLPLRAVTAERTS